jgi:hypothetical protein
MNYQNFKWILLLCLIGLNCSKSKDDNVNNDSQKFVIENKEYYFKSTSNEYHMILKTDSFGQVDTFWNININYTHVIYFHQDTTIRDTVYKYVWYKRTGKDYKIGVIRETADGKVFYRKNPYWPEFLLYDFNLKENSCFGNLIVKKIDNIQNLNLTRKRFLISQCCGRDTMYWIQGIGNTNNFLDNSFRDMCYCMDDGRVIDGYIFGGAVVDTKLLFVKINSSIIYRSPDFNGSTDDFKFEYEVTYN